MRLPLPGQFETRQPRRNVAVLGSRHRTPVFCGPFPATCTMTRSGPLVDPSLGYGDQDERTVISFGPDPDNKYVTTYFRHNFELTDVERFTEGIQLELLRDDGAAVYVNGNRVVVDRLPVVFSHDTLASGGPVEPPAESTFQTFSLSPSVLREGTNTDCRGSPSTERYQRRCEF